MQATAPWIREVIVTSQHSTISVNDAIETILK